MQKVSPITERLYVAELIIDSRSRFREELLHNWMNGRLLCVQFYDPDESRAAGWCLYFITKDAYIWVSHMEVEYGDIREAREAFNEYAKKHHKVQGYRFQTDRNPKAWERLWPGFKTKLTIMEKRGI